MKRIIAALVIAASVAACAPASTPTSETTLKDCPPQVTLADIPCLGPTRAPEIVVSNYDPATLEAINKELGAICKLLLDMDAKNYSPGSVKYLPSC